MMAMMSRPDDVNIHEKFRFTYKYDFNKSIV